MNKSRSNPSDTAESAWRQHAEVLRVGGIADQASLNDAARFLQRYCLRIIETTRHELEGSYGWDLTKFDAFIVENPEANAQLLHHEGRYGIVMYSGLPEQMHSYLQAALAAKEFLHLYITVEEREEWAFRFLGLVVEHVYLHECAHALRGHLLYLEQRNKNVTLDEKSRWQRRYIEIDADFHGLDMWFEITEAASDFPTSESLILDLYFQKLLTVIMLHHLYDKEGLPVLRRGVSTHPAPIHRAMIIDHMLFTTFMNRYQIPRSKMLNMQNQAWWEASVAAKAAGLVKNRWWGESGVRRGDQQYKRMWRYFVTHVEPRLNRFVDGLPDDLV
ncbi:MAG: hypothetical protein RSD81_02945 [Pseudomonas sp.]